MKLRLIKILHSVKDLENNPEIFWVGFFAVQHRSEGRHPKKTIIKPSG